MSISLDNNGNVFERIEDCRGQVCGVRPCACRDIRTLQKAPGGLTLGQIEETKLALDLEGWMKRFEF